MTQKQFAALLGFAFAAAWISFNFGYALLCLLGAAAFYAGASFLQGELDVAEIQDRLTPRRSPPAAPPPAPPPPPVGGARVR
jgi:hypothetical protein